MLERPAAVASPVDIGDGVHIPALTRRVADRYG
jgi:hypothetical protein